MLRNYLKIGFRSLVRQKIYSIINILGLSVGIASVVLILLHVEDEVSYDKFHEKGDRIYKVFLERIYPDHITKYAIIPHSFSEVMVSDYAEVENSVRLFSNNNDIVVTYTNEETNEQRSFEERDLLLADSTFFDVFSIKLILGDPATAISNAQDLVITQETALKYFGDEDPINKTLQTDFGPFTIKGVCENVPENSHFDFDFIGSLKTFGFFQNINFTGFSAHTYLLLAPGTDPASLEAKFPEMVENYAGPQIQQNLNTTYDEYVAAGNGYNYSLVNLFDIHLNPVKYENQIKAGGSSLYVYIFISIAVLILIIACINFMNLATARSSERSKEVGIRKTLGSNKQQLIKQFLVESVLISLISMVIAFAIVYLVLPYFNSLSGKTLTINPEGSLVLPAMMAFSIVVGLLAGSYPAFVLSSFDPAVVLKGNMQTSKSNSWLRNGLVIFQFFISIVLISGTIIVQRQMTYIQNMDLGYNKENVIIVERAQALAEQSESFLEEARQLPNVLGAASSSNMPGAGYFGIQFQPEGGNEVFTANSMGIADGYVENIGFEIIEGRNFSPDFNDSLSLLINEQMRDLLETDNVIGFRLSTNLGNQTVVLEVVGVVRDFNYMSVKEKISPFVLMSSEIGIGGPPPLISVRVDGNYQDVLASLESRWNELVPGQPFKYSFFDDNLAKQYTNEANSGKLLAIFAILAIIIACVGLFGLAAFTAGLRTKEIGVRKVMGASVFSVVAMLSREFTILILIALIFAIPISWYTMDKWLENFAYKTSIGFDVFLIAGLSALSIAWITVSYQSIKAAIVNPVRSLRSE